MEFAPLKPNSTPQSKAKRIDLFPNHRHEPHTKKNAILRESSRTNQVFLSSDKKYELQFPRQFIV